MKAITSKNADLAEPAMRLHVPDGYSMELKALPEKTGYNEPYGHKITVWT
ncbi:MAG TPA: hypothetical protein VMX75_09435 [Spirochaetia bacterium]|nr:hypothetical protein [Spirochaetia bacterium]